MSHVPVSQTNAFVPFTPIYAGPYCKLYVVDLESQTQCLHIMEFATVAGFGGVVREQAGAYLRE
jgi:hypothetical protein